jgi:cell fate (sporulation/competence/biofilm development) regulator YmcA (YheA/YmcA/DUF963 family)
MNDLHFDELKEYKEQLEEKIAGGYYVSNEEYEQVNSAIKRSLNCAETIDKIKAFQKTLE